MASSASRLNCLNQSGLIRTTDCFGIFYLTNSFIKIHSIKFPLFKQKQNNNYRQNFSDSRNIIFLREKHGAIVYRM